jgi:hypothetical protein
LKTNTSIFGTGTNIEVTSTTTITYTHDACDRLVGVEYGQTVRGSYVYNGLNWRILKQADTDGTGGPDQQRLMHDSAAPGNGPEIWQLLEEDRRNDWSERTPGRFWFGRRRGHRTAWR